MRQQFDTNVFGVIRVNRAVLPQLGSVLGRLAFPFVGLYGASKFALEGLTEAYRYELAALGIDAVLVEPSTYPTHLSLNSQEPADKDRAAPYAAVMNTLIPRFSAAVAGATLPDPQEVANAITTLIALPPGERPLRTIVTPLDQQRQALQGINDGVGRVARTTLELLGVLPLVTLAPKP